jgi:hypothetical protein
VGVDIVEIGIERLQPLFGCGTGIEFAHHVGLALGASARLFLDFTALVTLQQRVALKLGIDEGLKLHVRHLQQLDRLLQLGRHDQGLALADLEPLAYGHDAPSKPVKG